MARKAPVQRCERDIEALDIDTSSWEDLTTHQSMRMASFVTQIQSVEDNLAHATEDRWAS